MKTRINVSLDEETVKKLKEKASEKHTTVSQWITDRVWEEKEEEKKAKKGSED